MHRKIDKPSSSGDLDTHPNRFSLLSVTVAVLLAISWSIPIEAQDQSTPTARFSSEISVEVVTVDVVATDKKGNPITDLAREDFRIFEDGVEMEITNFFASLGNLPAAHGEIVSKMEVDNFTNPTPPLRRETANRHVALYLDHVFMRPESLRRLVPELQQFIKEQFPPGTLMMLVVYDGLVKVRVPFTDDAEQIISALDEEIKHSGHAGMMDGVESFMLRSWVQTEDAVAGGNDAMIALIAEERQASLDALAEDYRSVIRMAWRSLQYFVDSFAALPGRKIIVHISDGIPFRPDHWNNPGSRSGGRNVQPQGSLREFDDVIAHACSLGVTVHTVYGEGGSRGAASGSVISPAVSGSVAYRNSDRLRAQQMNTYFNSTTTLQAIAEGTGGMSVLKPTAKTLAPLGADVSSYYSLGYRPPRPGDGKTHKIEVKIDRKGVRVRHRSRYIALSPRDRVAAQTLASLVLPEVENPLRISWTVPRPGQSVGENIRLPIEVMVPSDVLAFQPTGEKWSGRVRIFVVTADLGRELGPLIELAYPIEIAELPDESNRIMFHIPVEFELSPGQHTVAVTVLDEISGISSSIPTNVMLDGSGGVWRLVEQDPADNGSGI